MPTAAYMVEARPLIAETLDRVEVAIEDCSPAVKRMVARKIIEVECDLYNLLQSDRDIPHLELVLRNFEQDLGRFSEDRRDDVGDGPGPYAIEGIAFGALVQLVRLEPCALHLGWLPEQLRDLGLNLQRDEEIIWPAADHVEIRNSSGRVRHWYRLH